ncbi:MAG: DotI/IcmL family type IV secretion protein [Gammaproteobacteria bacterium]|nr:DotI/IcmL family type IV secretion protein [Gammaproteobacteria bacterium]
MDQTDKARIKAAQKMRSMRSIVAVSIKRSSVLMKLHMAFVKYGLLGILIGILVLSAYMTIIIEDSTPPDTYSFNKTSTSKIVTLELPRLSNESVLSWVTQTISDIFTFNFADDLDKHFNKINEYFTEEGFSQYQDSLNDSSLLTDLVTKQLSYTANSCDVVSVINQRQVDIDSAPVTVWAIQVPILLQVQSNSPTRLIRYVVSVIVESGKDVRPDKSIGIAGINMSIAGEGTCGART